MAMTTRSKDNPISDGNIRSNCNIDWKQWFVANLMKCWMKVQENDLKTNILINKLLVTSSFTNLLIEYIEPSNK
jgi:hypothetical protein